jgi:hypothetical protein
MRALFEVFFRPAAAFESLRAQRWAWLLATTLTMVLGLLSVVSMLNRFSISDILDQQAAVSGRDLPPEAYDQAAGLITATMYVAPILSIPLMVLTIALVLLAAVKGFAGQTNYLRMLNAAAFAVWPWTLVSTMFMLLMLYAAPDLKTYNMQNPLPLNLAFFLGPDDVGKGLSALFSGVNLLNFYFIYLLAAGASALSDGVKPGQVLLPIAGIYVVWIFGKAGMAVLFG